MNLLEIVAGRPVLGVGPDGRPRSLLQWVRHAASVPVPQICRHVTPCCREALHGLLARLTPSAGAWRPGFVFGLYETSFPLEIRYVNYACPRLDKLYSRLFGVTLQGLLVKEYIFRIESNQLILFGLWSVQPDLWIQSA